MTAIAIKLMSALLLANAALHVAVAALDSPVDLRLPLIAFGLVYGALGLWLRSAKRMAVLVTIALTAFAVVAGGLRYLSEGGPLAMVVMFAIDAAVIAAGAWWLVKAKSA